MLEPSTESVPPPQPQPSPHKRGALETAAYIAVIVGVIAFLGNRALEYVRETGATAAAAGGDSSADKMLTHSETSATAASTTFTNMRGFTMHSCFKGRVTNKTTHEKVESMVACSGDVKPYSTVTVEAPYDPGEVIKLCQRNSEAGLDWDLCEFTFVEIKQAAKTR
jgi:hypothetical protein